jgi:hypothetical protein
VDENFGPFFLKFCSYFPYNAKLCLNGHEYAKRQLEREKITYQALDNGTSLAPIPNGCRPSAMPCQPIKSMRCCESGSAACPIHFRPEIGKTDTDIKSPFGKSSCP